MGGLGGAFAVLALLLIPTACGAVADEAEPAASRQQLKPTASPGPTGPDVRPLPPQDEEYVVLKAARYALPLPPFLITAVDVPDSWSVHQGHYLSAGPIARGDGQLFVAPAPEDSTAVPADPCRDHQRYTVVGPTERALATALSRQPFLDVSPPERVVIGGRVGAFVRVEVPADAEIMGCADRAVDLYTQGAREDAWRVATAGYVVRLWILDVDGERYVVHAESGPDATRRDVAVLRRMVESITFERVG